MLVKLTKQHQKTFMLRFNLQEKKGKQEELMLKMLKRTTNILEEGPQYHFEGEEEWNLFRARLIPTRNGLKDIFGSHIQVEMCV